MARRLSAFYRAEPVSTLATWSRHIALFALVATVLSIVIARFGILEIRPALMMFFGALACAALSILLALAGFAAIWRSGARGLGRIALALLIDVVILVYPAYLAAQYRLLPPIHDITTDAIDPPKFEALAILRAGQGANGAAYAGLYSAELQREAYPAIEPVTVETSPQVAYDTVLALINRRRWRVVNNRPPRPPNREGQIEAVARTLFMGFRDDVAVRVTPDGDGARIDLRSASRYFKHDLGANAARLASLIEDINNAVDAAEKVQKKPEPARKGQPGKAPARR